MRFDLVDTVVERGPGRLVAIKNVTAAEEYLGDHFPGFPVLPGVMMLEAMVQAARRLMEMEAADEGAAARRWVLAEVRGVRYGNMVKPGRQLRVSVERKSDDGERHTFQGQGTVEGESAVRGRFVLRPATEPAGFELQV